MRHELWSDGTGNYLKIYGGEDEAYSDRMFSCQNIAGFLPLQIQWINGKKEYLYDVSDKVCLRDYLAMKVFSAEEIREMMLDLLDMTCMLEEYLLDPKGLVIREEYLFVERGTGKLYGIYVPGEEESYIPALGRLLEFVMEKMNQKDRELVFFVYGMHKLTKEAACTRSRLIEYIQEKPVPAKRTEPVKKGLTKPAIVMEKWKLPRKKTEYLLPVAILAAAIIFMTVVMYMGKGMDELSLVGLFIISGSVAAYGIRKTLPERFQYRRKIKDVIEEKEQKNNLCLIPQNSMYEPIEIKKFPCRINREENMVKVSFFQECGNIFVKDEESEIGILRNGERLVPYQKCRIADGNLLQLGKREYVVEITQSSYAI